MVIAVASKREDVGSILEKLCSFFEQSSQESVRIE